MAKIEIKTPQGSFTVTFTVAEFHELKEYPEVKALLKILSDAMKEES